MATDKPTEASGQAEPLIPLSIRARRGSTASTVVSLIDKEQMAQALDRIHTSASRTDSLTTFNDFATPPAPAATTDGKGSGTGISGLYSRIKEAVGVGAKGQEAEHISASTKGSAQHETTINGPHGALSRAESGSVSLTTSATKSDVSLARIGGSGNSAVPSSRVSLTAKNPQYSAASSSQSLPKVVKAPAGTAAQPTVAPVTVAAVKSHHESVPSPNERQNDFNSHGVQRTAGNFPEIPTITTASVDSDARNQRVGTRQDVITHSDNRRAIASTDGSWDDNAGQTKRRGHSPADLLSPVDIHPSSSTSRGRGADAIRKPAVIDRIDPSRDRKNGHSRSSSMEPPTTEPSPINTSAHNSVYHDSFAQHAESGSGDMRIPGTTNNEGAPEMVNARLESMRKQVMSKKFWMADETCKECFLCAAPFSAFRRKHHCRTCGCIFDSKCTSVISGQKFGVQGNLRVCHTCLGIINSRYDSVSDDSGDDNTYLPAIFRPPPDRRARSPSGASLVGKDLSIDTDVKAVSNNRSAATPMMAIPATRRLGGPNRNSAILEFDAPQLSRPGSSKSLKSLAAGRPQSSGHKRNQSKSSFFGRFKAAEKDSVPFRSTADEEANRKSKLPAFHDDNIIDPDLAPYMSDESSGDEAMSIIGTMATNELAPSSLDHEKPNFGPMITASRRTRFRQGDKSVSGVSLTSRGQDDGSTLAPLGPGYGRPPTRRRNLSTTSASIYHLHTPRPRSVVFKGPSTSTDALSIMDSPTVVEINRAPRSYDALKNNKPLESISPTILNHVTRLFRQLLQDSNISNVSAWEKAVIPVLFRCVNQVSPDVRGGDAMDIRHYVKLKKIPGGKPCDSSYVSGVIFSKNLALKSMPRKIYNNPRIAIVSFPIEYQRAPQQHFTSLEPVIAQEREFLKKVVSRITALRPQVLLAQKSISGIALQFLAEANIAVAYNVKPSVIEAVSRIAKVEIISSLDMLALPVQIGHAGAVEVKTFVNDDLPGKKKTYIFISGCDIELGCTLALRGGPMEVLRRLKRITEFMLYVVYNLKLETAMMQDERIKFHVAPSPSRASLPTTVQPTNTTLPVAGHGNGDASTTSTQPRPVEGSEAAAVDTQSSSQPTAGAGIAIAERTKKLISLHESHSRASHDSHLPEDVPMPTFYSDMVAKYETRILSASPFVRFNQPYLLVKAREQERRLVYLKRLRDQDIIEDSEDTDSTKRTRFQLIKPEMVHETGQEAPRQIMEVLHAVHDAEYDKALYNYQTQTRQWENYIQGSLDLFDPYSHQSIVVLYSLICTETKIPCAEPGLIAIGFYDERPDASGNMDPDFPLGQYVEDLCGTAEDSCPSSACDRPLWQHHRTYVHGEARVTVFIEKNSPLPEGAGKESEDDIFMWSYCKQCKKDLGVFPMSEGTWKYSFGKYLELAFWGYGLYLVDETGCPHDHKTEHIRYFHFRNNTVRIHYDPIEILEIVVPRARITWKVDQDLKLKNEIFGKIEERWTRFMTSVKTRLKSFQVDSVLPEKIDACKLEVERLAKKAQEDQPVLIANLQKTYMSSKYYEVIPLNVVVREMLERVTEWDAAFTKFESDFLSDKDVRQLTILQLKKMFSDNDSKETLPATDGSSSVVSENDGKTTPTASLAGSLEMNEKTNLPANDLKKAIASSTSPTAALPLPLPKEPSAEETEELVRVSPLDLAKPPSPTLTKSSPAIADSAPDLETGSVLTQIAKPLLPESTGEAQHPASAGTVLSSEPEQIASVANKLPAQASPVDDVHRAALERGISRKAGLAVSPPLLRALSQPVGTLPRQNSAVLRQVAAKEAKAAEGDVTDQEGQKTPTDASSMTSKKFSDRIGLSALKKSKHGQSSIPRYAHGKKKEPKVSNLARHFEQLSREFSKEFERERIRERKQRAAKMPHARAFLPRASTRAIVEVYDDVDQAVHEPGPTDEEHIVETEQSGLTSSKPDTTAEQSALNSPVKSSQQDSQSPTETPSQAEATPSEAGTETHKQESRAGSDDEGAASETEPSLLEELLPEGKEIAGSLEGSEENVDLAKHQKSSLMNMLTNFWAERSASGWTPLEYPLNATDHIFIDSDIIVREDEPSSLIALALGSDDYQAKLADIRHQWKLAVRRGSQSGGDLLNTSGNPQEPEAELPVNQDELEKSLIRSTGTHLKYLFTEGSSKMLCKVFYAEQFDALRRKCGVADRIIESLSRCAKWDSKGGKTKSVFLKTLDDRLVMKSLSPVETSAFLRFAPAYFSIMAEALFHDLPSVIAKMLGFFQIYIKNPLTGAEIKLDLLVMENLFYDRVPSRIFDLKGSMRNRRIQSTGEQNEVLLDENMVEYIYESPLFAREHSKKLLRASVWNDTLFLARQNVMDYSLMIAVDEARKELVVGIIDCIRTYTWDKRLESWIKDRGFAGGGRNKPTVTSPKEYKSRFREAMARYILQAPNCWHHFAPSSAPGGVRARFEGDV